MSRRLAVTPVQLRNLLEALAPFGFSAAKVQVTTDGAVILYGEAEPVEVSDPLAQWEAERAPPPN